MKPPNDLILRFAHGDLHCPDGIHDHVSRPLVALAFIAWLAIS
jgi:hypothetical protein